MVALEGGAVLPVTTEAPTTVTSGGVRLQIVGEEGRTEVEVEVAEGERLVFDPAPWLPTSLVLSGLPAGTDYRIYLEGQGDALLEREAFVPLDGGGLDPTTGVRIAPAQHLKGLIGGTGGLFIEHPSLGDGATLLTLEPGTTNTIQYRWRSMAGIPGVEARYRQWKEDRDSYILKTHRRTRISLAATIVSSVAAAVFWTGAGVVSRDVAAEKARGVSAAQEGDWSTVTEANLANQDAARTQNGLAIAGTIAGIGAAAGVVVTISFDRRGRARIANFPGWDPFQ